MSMHRRNPSTAPHHSVLLTALLLALPLAAMAQSAPASSSASSMDMSSMQGMDHGSMPGTAMPAPASSTANPATKAPIKKAGKKPVPASATTASHSGDDMKGMDHSVMSSMPMPVKPAASAAPTDDMSGMDHSDMVGMDHGALPKTAQGVMPVMGAMPGMTMGPMQGGRPPSNTRSPDYSDGVGYGSMKGMDMADNAPLGMLLIDRLEAFHGRDANGQNWEAEGWYGNDENKLWIRTEGERSRGQFDDSDLEVFWNRSIATYWSTQLGVRHDLDQGPGRTWAAFGVQGLTPYWFAVQATGYVGASGRTAARLRIDYEMLFTQRLILQPEAETNLYGKNDPQRRIGSGVSDVQFGLRLRYEIRREFAPYVGIDWIRRVGTTADYARAAGHHAFDQQLVAGFRIWFPD
jgi:copper resistance protein B